MVFVANALGGWLVGQLADAGRKKLTELVLGSEQERALRRAADIAVWATAEEVSPSDGEQTGQIAMVISEVFRDPVPDAPLAGPVMLLEGLQAGIAGQLAVLDDAGLTGTGQSSADVLRVPGAVLADRLTAHLAREIIVRGSGGGPLAPLADQFNHELTRLQIGGMLAQLASEVRDALSLSGSAAAPVGWPLAEVTDPFLLEVHRPVEPDVPRPELPVLPVYVPRDHDAALAKVVTAGAAGTSGIAVLVGRSSTGKTRACWQALDLLRGLEQGWRLWHPIDPQAALAELPGVEPWTVVWLNEAQRYLNTSNGTGERVGAGLRDLLRAQARGPVLVLATLWPEYWGKLIARPPGGPDPHAQARELLTGHDIHVPAVFTPGQLRELKAARDPRLAQAAWSRDGEVIQYLAGAPELLARYHHAPPAARALIHAAMDAAWLGMSPALPQAFLEAAAAAYLTNNDWDLLPGEWLEQALAYAAEPCRGTRGPLTRIRPRPGEPALMQPHYRLADYLEETRRTDGAAAPAPAQLWDVLIAHAAREDLPQIAARARHLGLYRHAFNLFAAADEAHALAQAADMLHDVGRTTEAATFYQRAAEAGDTSAMGRAAEMLRRTGRTEDAITWLQSRAEAGDTSAMGRAAEMLQDEGRTEDAITWLQSRAQAGDTSAMGRAAEMLQDEGRTEDAITWLQPLAEAGDTSAMWWEAKILRHAGRTGEAITFYRRAASAGIPNAIAPAADMLREAGRTEDAITWLQSLAQAGDASAMWRVAEMLRDEGRTEDAITWLQSRAAAGDLNAVWRVAEMLRDSGRPGEAAALYQRTAETGDTSAVGRAAEMLWRAGRTEDAITWLQPLAEAGDTSAMWWVAKILRHAGRTGEAITFYRRVASAGIHDAIAPAADMLRDEGRTGEAITWLQSLAEAGDGRALVRAADMLRDEGRTREAITFYRRAASAGIRNAIAPAADMLREAGRTGEAITWLQSLAEAGEIIALRRAADMLRDEGRTGEAITWLQSRAEAGDTEAMGSAAQLMAKAGQTVEAVAWLRPRCVAGDLSALVYAAMLLEDLGRSGEALPLFQPLAEAGDTTAMTWVAALLRDEGRTSEAVTVYLQATEAGEDCLKQAVETLQKAGLSEEAMRLHRYGIEPGGRIADRWDASTPNKSSQPAGPTVGAGVVHAGAADN